MEFPNGIQLKKSDLGTAESRDKSAATSETKH